MNTSYDIDDLQRADVIDSNGDKVGGVGQVYLDDSTGEPSFVTVKTGFFGTNESFVPLRGAEVSGDEVRVPYTKDVIKDAPNISEDGHLEPDQEDEIHRYYAAADSGVAGSASYRDGDRDRDDRAIGDRDLDVDRDHGDGDSVVRREEELHVGTERVETGRVRLRKHVVTETKTVQVPVEREEVEVVREPIADGEGRRGGELADDETEVRLTEERPVVEKEVVDKERVGLDKRTVSDTREVEAEVGREEVEVVGDGHEDGRVGR